MQQANHAKSYPTPNCTSPIVRAPCSRGVDLVRMEVISDDKGDIAATALRLRELVGSSGAVITSGGIGPTYDDVTYEALAAAYGMCLAQPKHAIASCLIPLHSLIGTPKNGGVVTRSSRLSKQCSRFMASCLYGCCQGDIMHCVLASRPDVHWSHARAFWEVLAPMATAPHGTCVAC